MNKVTEILLSNIGPYKNIRVPLTDNDGLVVVVGLNKDSKISKAQSNGSGKSVLFGAIPTCRYSSGPSTVSKNSKKDLLSTKKSKIGLRFIKEDGRKIQFTQHTKGWKIYIDGVDQEVHRIEHQMKKMEELWPITEDEFYAYTYLSSILGQRLHFQVDKPANRLKFITEIFHLDDYDKMKKYFTQMLGKIKEEQIKFDVLESKMLGVTTSLSKLKWDDEMQERLATLKEKLKGATAKIDALSDTKNRLIVDMARNKTTLKQITKLYELRAQLKTIDKAIIRAKLENAEAYEEYKRDLAKYEEQNAKVTTRLEKLNYDGVVPDIENLKLQLKEERAKLKKFEERYEEAERTNRVYEKSQEKMVKLQSQIFELGFQTPKHIVVPDSAENEMAMCRATIQLKKLLDGDKHSHCPTCQQSVNIKEISKSVKTAEKRLSELKNIIAADDLYTQYKELRKELGKPVDIKDLKANGKRQTALVSTIEDNYERAQKITELLETQNDIAKPKKVKDVPKQKASFYREQLSVLREWQTLKEELGGASEKEIVKQINDDVEQLEATEAELKKIQAKVRDGLEKKSKYEMASGEYKVLAKQRAEYELELEAVKPILAKRDMYKALEKAWGAKGMKVGAANSIVALLEANLNRYAELIFAEPFQFHVYTTEAGVFCEVNRGNGSPSTDVRLMSGAESDAFRLLFLLALLLMVEPERRTNFVILDEPDSHMDDATRALFIDSYLPFLRQIVPHTFVITPNDPNLYEDTTIWRIVKHKGESKLVMEH